MREASTTIIVTSIPHLYALIRRVFSLEAVTELIKRPIRICSSKYCTPNLQLTERQNVAKSESTEDSASNTSAPLWIWQ